MTLFDELNWRGFVNQVTHDELGGLLEKEPFTLYCGFDPTADSLHIGNLVPIMGLAHFQRKGHKPLVLIGGATGLIGDPSERTQERQLLTKADVEKNLAGIRAQLERFVTFEGKNAAVIVNNAEWLCSMPLIDFLRDIGKHFSVNVMLSKESVRQRITDRDYGMSFTEFSYSLLQAYDFLHLSDTYDCRLQVGGSDQWGNIVAGMDLIRRLRDRPAFGLTFPLVLKSDGSKFGKSESGNVWLGSDYTSPYKFYQFWLNQADADTPRWLRYFTFLAPEAIAESERGLSEEPEKRAAQRLLAEQVTRLVHGETALSNAIRASRAMFNGAPLTGPGAAGGDIKGLDDATVEDVFSEVPSYELPRAELAKERLLADVLVQCGIFKSKGEVRRSIEGGGLYLNNERVDALDVKLTQQSLCSAHTAVIRKGKKDYHLIRFTDA